MGKLNHLARVHDIGGVQGILYLAHQIHFHLRLIALGFIPAQTAEAVFGADRAIQLGDQIMHDAVDGAVLCPKIGTVNRFRLGRIVVDIAIANMTE